MTIEQLYEIAGNQGISIYDFPMLELRAVSLYGGHIAIDRRKCSSDTEYKCVLAHEIGHCQTNSFYTVNTQRCDRELCERHANRFAVELLVPLDDLKRAMHRGLLFAEILVRIFDVTPEFIRMVLELYEQELFAAARIRVAPYQIKVAVINHLMPVVGTSFVDSP